MSESQSSSTTVRAAFPFGIGLGVFWFVNAKVGFLWAVVYGLFWPLWVGYRLAEWLWR
jgi:hypothetical protein